jgi:hypothetical protein
MQPRRNRGSPLGSIAQHDPMGLFGSPRRSRRTLPLQRQGPQDGNHSSGYSSKLVLKCHEPIAVVQSSRRGYVSKHGEGVLHRTVCQVKECQAEFFICSHCYCGQRYCSLSCRRRARLERHRCANRRYQSSAEGQKDHSARQERYRRRCAQARWLSAGLATTDQKSVTDHSSNSTFFTASSSCDKVEATIIKTPPRSAMLPDWPEKQPPVWLRCRICGRTGRLANPLRVAKPEFSP